MTLTLIFFILGLVLVVRGASMLVDGASAIAKRFGISALVIGLTIVAFGTSAPELSVNILASLKGNTDIAIGNILGSNIFNTMFILGISAIIYPLTVSKGTVWKEIPFALLAVILLGVMASDNAIDGASFSGLTRIDGFVLLSFFVIFLYYTFGISKVEKSPDSETSDQPDSKTLSLAIILILAGLAGLVLGGKWVVDGAIAFAQYFGVSEAIIGLTVVAIGTSLPELATSVVAVMKREVDIAVGNIIGSNIFNVFLILGISASINPLPFSQGLMSDVFVAIFAAAILFIFMFIRKRHTLERWQGVILVFLYVVYVTFLVMKEFA